MKCDKCKKELTEAELVDRVAELEREVAWLKVGGWLDVPIHPPKPNPFEPWIVWWGDDTSVKTRFE